MGKSNANECNESSLSNCRVQLALSTKKDGMILEKRLDNVRNQNPFSILLRKISVFRRNAPIDTKRFIQDRDTPISLRVIEVITLL